MRVYKILPKTKAEGPGIRFCIWVQGCGHHCKGCFAKRLWDYEDGDHMSADQVIVELSRVIDEVEGITFLGGEPFDQAEELERVARYVKEHEKNVITFSGYTYETLLENEKYKGLLEYTDLLCDGPYIEELTDYSRPLLGSSNQRFIFLSDAITKEEMDRYHNSFEIRVSKNGQIEVNGMGNINKLKDYLLQISGGENGYTSI